MGREDTGASRAARGERPRVRDDPPSSLSSGTYRQPGAAAGAGPPRVQTSGTRKRRFPQTADRGSKPLCQARAIGLEPAMGFATSADEHVTVTEEVERAKLARVIEVARQVWGSA